MAGSIGSWSAWSSAGRHLQVNAPPDSAVYEVVDGEPLELLQHGESFSAGPGLAADPARAGAPPASA